MPAIGIREIVIDVPNERAEEAFVFYQQLTGFSGSFDSDNPNNLLESLYGPDLGLQQVDGYRAPTWPTQERGQQVHLCLGCVSFADGIALIERLGGSQAAHQPSPDCPIVLDPFGHPMCLAENPDLEPGSVRLRGVALDCADHGELAQFYLALFGGELSGTDDREFTSLDLPGGFMLSCEQVQDDYQPSTWPTQERGQQLHIDCRVEDVAAVRDHVLELGGRVAFAHPEYPNWIVLADPAGHPFCINSEL